MVCGLEVMVDRRIPAVAVQWPNGEIYLSEDRRVTGQSVGARRWHAPRARLDASVFHRDGRATGTRAPGRVARCAACAARPTPNELHPPDVHREGDRARPPTRTPPAISSAVAHGEEAPPMPQRCPRRRGPGRRPRATTTPPA